MDLLCFQFAYGEEPGAYLLFFFLSRYFFLPFVCVFTLEKVITKGLEKSLGNCPSPPLGYFQAFGAALM